MSTAQLVPEARTAISSPSSARLGRSARRADAETLRAIARTTAALSLLHELREVDQQTGGEAERDVHAAIHRLKRRLHTQVVAAGRAHP